MPHARPVATERTAVKTKTPPSIAPSAFRTVTTMARGDPDRNIRYSSVAAEVVPTTMATDWRAHDRSRILRQRRCHSRRDGYRRTAGDRCADVHGEAMEARPAADESRLDAIGVPVELALRIRGRLRG